ncbi:ABC transporter permease [uncultured Abiotrophia sp.]|uniref:ABC transporter permease n=1 Tax=uncultured Abiotrophia sp. TaxID=316094 RepID=UPI0028D381EA|nr:ABC transporter permease [uncultured Abiotrophia sp.]
MKNLRALIKVETYFTLRNWQSLVMAIGMPLAFYLLFSGIYQAEMPYSYRVFMMISMTASSLLSFNVFALPYNLTADKHNNWRRFLHHSPVSVVQYYLVKALRFVLLYSLAIGVVFSFGGLVRQITLPVGDYFTVILILLVGMIPFSFIGALISYLPSEETISMVGNIAFMAMSLLGGLWMPLMFFPQWMQNLAKWIPSYHLMQIIQNWYTNRVWAWDSILALVAYGICFLILIALVQGKIEVK